MSGNSTTPPPPTGQAAWSAEMQHLQEQSMQESFVEADTNRVINRNNATAQTANGVGRT